MWPRSFPSPHLCPFWCVRVCMGGGRFLRPGPLWPLHTRSLDEGPELSKGPEDGGTPAPKEGSLWTGPLILCHSPQAWGVWLCENVPQRGLQALGSATAWSPPPEDSTNSVLNHTDIAVCPVSHSACAPLE